VSNLSSIPFYYPELLLVITILLAIIADLIPGLRRYNYYISLLGIIGAGLLLSASSGAEQSLYMGTIAIDPFSHFFKWIFLISGFITIFATKHTSGLDGVDKPEFNVLLLIVLVGLFLMASATNLITVYLGIETVSIPSYILEK